MDLSWMMFVGGNNNTDKVYIIKSIGTDMDYISTLVSPISSISVSMITLIFNVRSTDIYHNFV